MKGVPAFAGLVFHLSQQPLKWGGTLVCTTQDPKNMLKVMLPVVSYAINTQASPSTTCLASTVCQRYRTRCPMFSQQCNIK